MKVKNMTVPIFCALVNAAALSYCLAQNLHAPQPSNYTGWVEPGVNYISLVRPYNAALEARDQKYESLVELGQKLLVSDPQAAEAEFRKAIAVNRQPADAWMGLARASDSQGKTSQALSAYRHVFDSSNSGMYSNFPSDVEALAHYGLLCEDAGEHDAAIRACNNAGERLNPKPKVSLGAPLDRRAASPELRARLEVVRGFALNQQGKTEDALVAFAHAASLQPSDAHVQFYLGNSLRKAGQFDAAQAAFQKAAQLDTEGTVKVAADENLRAVQAHRR